MTTGYGDVDGSEEDICVRVAACDALVVSSKKRAPLFGDRNEQSATQNLLEAPGLRFSHLHSACR